MDKKGFLAFALAVSAAFCCRADAITVSGVTIAQNPLTRLVTVDYTLGVEPAIVTVDFLTNGVSIGEANFRNVFGDVNRLVDTNGTRRICWRPDLSWTGHSIPDEIVTAKVTAWAKDDPPDYMVVALDTTTPLSPVSYYVSTNALPDGGLANDVYRTSRIVMRRIHAAGVRWLMGNDGSEVTAAAYETPHYVTLTEDYYIGIFEVTQEQHRQFSGDGYTEDSTYGKTRNDIAVSPKVNIQWRYLRGNSAPVNKWRTLGTDRCDFKTLRNRTGIDFDLPTDAQWEFAARAGATHGIMYEGITYNNAASVKKYEWYYGNSDKHTEANGYPGGDGKQHGHPVGSKQPNPFGLYDMLGNAAEMCLDVYTADLGENDVEDPIGASGSDRVRRGGNINNSITPYIKGTYRTSVAPNTADYKIGYRLMCPIGLKFPTEEVVTE